MRVYRSIPVATPWTNPPRPMPWHGLGGGNFGAKIPESVSGGECGFVKVPSRASVVALVSRFKIGDGTTE